MRIKSVCAVAGVVGALFVSTTAEADLTGIEFTAKISATNPRLLICNLFVTFTPGAGDQLVALAGLPALDGPQMVFSTNSVPGFHQEIAPIGPQDLPLNGVLLPLFPNYADDTYITIGLKAGYAPGALTMGEIGVLPGTGGATTWNAGGSLLTDLINGGAYFVFPGAPEAVEIGGQVLIAQLVLDGNALTTDGLAPRIDVFIPQIFWRDALGNVFGEGLFPPGPGQTPGPGFSASHEGGPPPPDEACCFGDGSCRDLPEDDCLAAGGTPQGPGTVCNGGVSCPPPGDDCSGFPCGNNNNKVVLCHVPPGNPENPQTLCISPNAVPAHLANHPGDHCGPCEDNNDDGGVPLALLAVESNAPGVLIDVTPMENNEEGGGFAPFERSYELFSFVSLTAPKTQQGRTFVRWDFGDTAFVVGADGLTLHLLVIIGYPQTVTAIYSPPQRNPGSPPRGK